MTDKEAAKLDKIKSYLDEKGISYKTHTENAVKKRAKSNIAVLGYKIYIRLSDENDTLFRRFHKGKSLVILLPDQNPSLCLWRVKSAIRDVEIAHEEEKANRAISFYSSQWL